MLIYIFVGLWRHENLEDPICVRSRTGFVVNFANCPLLWVSKLKTDITLSTLHSEYVALYVLKMHNKSYVFITYFYSNVLFLML